MKKIFIVDDEKNLIETLKESFEDKGFQVSYAYNGEDALKQISQELPDVAILDINLPKVNGYEICQKLRAQEPTHLMPILILTARDNTVDKVSGLRSGADDYITKPFDMEELFARIETLLIRKERLMSVSPLTGLPGNVSIVENTNKRIEQGMKFAFTYVDINNFKAYNDVYGFNQGDVVIKYLGELIRKSIAQYGDSQIDFTGHIGGDDFVFITDINKVDKMGEYLTTTFDKEIRQYYNETDQKNGYILTRDRRNIIRAFPLMSISIAAVTNVNRSFNHYGEIVNIVTELKYFAKTKNVGSVYIKDRRTN